MHHSKNKKLIYLVLAVLFISCEGEVGPQGIGLNSLTNVTNEPAGTNCENGGVKIEVGTDNNENGVLDTDEVLSTSYVCNGVDGAASLTIVTTEPAGTNCENGGIKIDSGVDTNGDGTLDGTEISATAYVCNGIDGNNSLTKITNEDAGTNCENGGLKIDSGVDANGDGTLDDTEISATAYVCNGVDGNNSLTKITNEDAGTNCENGGLKIDSGVDANGDGTLDDTEISATAYVCNGVDGNNSLTKITNEDAGTNCENGGLKIDSGVDANGDGTLDDTEISATAYVCNGVDGNNSLTKITNETAGTNCENGGLKIDSGIDANGDGTLDDTEISATAYVCNGIDGNNSLTKITNEAAGTNCENGGLKIDSGIDANNDGTLDDAEISATAYVCNGIDGNQSLTKVSSEDAGTICEAGGIKVESGIDSNSDSILDLDEIISTEYVCNGDFDKLVRVDLNLNSLGTSSTDWAITSFESFQLIRFSKNHYTNVDSITFVPSLFTSDGNNKVFAELYNVTDAIAISGTEIQSNENAYVFVESNNIYDLLPDEEKQITFRIRSENNGTNVQAGANNFLFIYRE